MIGRRACKGSFFYARVTEREKGVYEDEDRDRAPHLHHFHSFLLFFIIFLPFLLYSPNILLFLQTIGPHSLYLLLLLPHHINNRTITYYLPLSPPAIWADFSLPIYPILLTLMPPIALNHIQQKHSNLS